ncbi:MAG: molecular chaperone TorD family protein [Ramlibacter sp.]
MPEPLPMSSVLDEETARAEIYGLFAHLFYAAPAPDILQALRNAVTEAPAAGAFLEEPWRALVGLAREMQAGDIRSEYDALFGGVGRPDVYLFGSHYLSGFLNERPLAQLRDDLRKLGLTRDAASMPETEDHVAYLCEVMRHLIAGDAPPLASDRPTGGQVAIADLARQREFFGTHLQPWIGTLCDAIVTHPRSRFYAALARFAQAFAGVEQQGFDLLA